MDDKQTRLDVLIWRQSDKEDGAFQHFHVPKFENQTILDIVTWIQHNLDPSLSYRFACRVGMCGSCAMIVNGEPRWTCRTHVEKAVVDNSLKIEPLQNLPVIKDLAVDMSPFFEKWSKAEAHHHPGKSRFDAIEAVNPTSGPRVTANAGIECINCAICYSACDTVAGSPDYLGPAALQRAWTLVNDEKDAGYRTIMDAVTGSDGCHNCHSLGNCARYCPNDLNPTLAIAGLKRESIRNFLGGDKRRD